MAEQSDLTLFVKVLFVLESASFCWFFDVSRGLTVSFVPSNRPRR